MTEYVVVSGKMQPGLQPFNVAPGSQGLRTALITYDGLPTGPHSLGRLDAVKAWRLLSSFLVKCTSVLHQSQRLSVYVMGGRPTPSERVLLEEAKTEFGRPSVRKTGLHRHMREHVFALKSDQLERAVVWVSSHKSLPAIEIEPGYAEPALQTGLSVRFALLDPKTKKPLPFQGSQHYGGQGFDGYCASGLGESRMNVGLTNGKSWCYVALSFPFEEATEEFWAYVEELQHQLPFKFSANHWARWQLNKAGKAYYNRKLQPPNG